MTCLNKCNLKSFRSALPCQISPLMRLPPAHHWSERHFLDNFLHCFVSFFPIEPLNPCPEVSSDCLCVLHVKISVQMQSDIILGDTKWFFSGEVAHPHPAHSISAYGASLPYWNLDLNLDLFAQRSINTPKYASVREFGAITDFLDIAPSLWVVAPGRPKSRACSISSRGRQMAVAVWATGRNDQSTRC